MRVLARAGIAWVAGGTAESDQHDTGWQWRNKLAEDVHNRYADELTSDSGLRTVRCYVASISGWTEKRTNAMNRPPCFISKRDKRVRTPERAR